jgi:Bacterial type II and III secretion system protein/FG-GAP-like repeat
MAVTSRQSTPHPGPWAQKLLGLSAAVFISLTAVAARQEPAGIWSAAPPAKQAAVDPDLKLKPDHKRAKRACQQAMASERTGDWQAAYAAYSDAILWAPDNRDYALRRELVKGHLIQAKIDLAEKEAVSGRLSEARKDLLDASYLDPSDKLIRQRLIELADLEPRTVKQPPPAGQLVGEIHIEHQPGTRDFNFRGDTQSLYEEVARQFGVQAAFEADLHSHQVRFEVHHVDFQTAMELAGDATSTFWSPLTKHLFFVADDTLEKRREYEPLIVRTILLPASETPEQMTELSRLLREITGILRIDEDQSHGTLTLRADRRAMAVASDLIDNLEKPNGELVLEMEILEVDRSYAQQIGITPPQTSQVFPVNTGLLNSNNSAAQIISSLEQIFGTPSSLSGLTPEQIATEVASGELNLNSLLPPLVAFGGGASTFFATLPGATANLGQTLSLVRSGRRVLLRAEDGQEATFFIGEKYPVVLAQYSSSLTSNINTPAISSQNFPVTTLSTGNAPSYVTAASLRNNNIQDLMVTNHNDNTIGVFLGNGDGTFASQVTYPTGTGPAWIATGTFNSSNNANLDLAVANKGANTVSVLLGNGDGTFAPKVDYPTGAVPVSIAVGDFNGDGIPDLAIANQSDNTISLLFGDGKGGFSKPTTVPALLLTGHAPTALLAADFNGANYANGNPILDLAVVNQVDNTVEIFLGNGDGSFQPPTAYATGNQPVYVASSDFNGDGIPDLAVANFADNTVSILFGQSTPAGLGTGTFTAATDYLAGTGPTSIAVADYNLDGVQDLAVADSGSNTIAVLFGLTGGTFNSPYELSVGTDPLSIATANFDGTGRPDAAIANNGSNTVSVILNTINVASSSTGGEGTLFPGAQYIDIGLKIQATPRIHAGDEVTLKLKFDLTSLAGQSFNGIPVVTNDSLDQTVRLKENETAVLGGILQPSVSTNLNGTPGLSAIPGLGQTNTQQADTQLLVLITPRMVQLVPRTGISIYAGHGTGQGSVGFPMGFERRFGFPEEPNRELPSRPPQSPDQPQP